MKRALVAAFAVAALPAFAQPSGVPGGSVATTPPPAWEATRTRVMALALDGKHQEMVTLMEPIVARYPRFADGQFWLGAAHENLGRDGMRTDPAAARRHFELAATHGRRAYDLGGGGDREAAIRGLIDLYDYALPDPATRKALILDARTRYAVEPVVHWYYAQLLIEEQRIAELPTAFGVARKALPATPPDARLSFASLLVGLAERSTAAAVRATLAAEAEAYTDDILEAHPTGSYHRQAQRLKAELAKLRQTKGGEERPPPQV